MVFDGSSLENVAKCRGSVRHDTSSPLFPFLGMGIPFGGADLWRYPWFYYTMDMQILRTFVLDILCPELRIIVRMAGSGNAATRYAGTFGTARELRISGVQGSRRPWTPAANSSV